jgi:hypothetical protein
VRSILLATLAASLTAGATSAADEQQSPTPVPAAAPSSSPNPVPAATPGAVSYTISGAVRSGKILLPGVTVIAANTLTGKKFATTTGTDGSFKFTLPNRGRYVVRTEFLGFAPQTQEALLNPQSPAAKLDFEILLASRVQQQQQQAPATLVAGRGFQSLSIAGDLTAPAGLGNGGSDSSGAPGNNGSGSGGDISGLPFAGLGADAATESVVSGGGLGRSQDFGGGSDEQIQQRIQEFRDRSQREGTAGPFGGGGPGGGGPAVGRGGFRNFNINQPHGTLYFSDDNSSFDASPYSLTGKPTPKAGYNQARFGAFLGGPLNIPKIYHGGTKTFFFVGYNGSRAENPYDAFSTVPTMRERSGDFSQTTLNNGSPLQLFVPAQVPASCPFLPGTLFPNNVIPATCISSAAATAAAALLPFIPLPTSLQSSTQNFHYVTSVQNNTDSINLRLIHNFGAGGGGGFGGFGGGGGGRGGRRSGQNINFVLNYTRSNSQTANSFPSLAGTSGLQGLNAGAGYTYNKGKLFNLLRFNYNHNHTSVSNLYAFGPPATDNIIGLAGIGGASQDPFDFGLPRLSLTNFRSVSDPSTQRRLDQTYTFSDTVGWSHGKHTMRFGADYRRILQGIRSDQNARGSFTFTGFATSQLVGGVPVPGTGFDFADFLLGLPQATSIQCGSNFQPGLPQPTPLQCGTVTFYDFRANSYDVFAQDEWKTRANLTFNFGLRYEYPGPFTDTQNRIVNLDISPGLTCVEPVMPGAAGPCTGSVYPVSLVQPDRNNFAPRIGIAWKPIRRMVVRAGYGINYNLAQYTSMIQQFAFQPPFSLTETNAINLCPSITLTSGFLSLPANMSCTAPNVTNNYAVDKNYRLGYVQLWNLNIQTELPGNTVAYVGYNAAKGTHLDLVEAPNRTPIGLLVPGVQAFLFDTSQANSILHAATVSVRKRLQHGISVSATYVFSKSIDDASSIGGGGVVVAQNAQDIAAERGLSSFDQRHKFTGNWIYELPFGPGKSFLQTGKASRILSGWQWSGDFTIASGTPFSPRILNSFSEVNSGTSGTLRPDVTGQPVSLSNSTVQEFFNPAAFTAPASGQFGDAGRNIIPGPGQITFGMAFSKTFQIKETRSLEFRASANNIFNHVNFASIDPTVNSPTYGQVVSTGSMRRMSLLARFRF